VSTFAIVAIALLVSVIPYGIGYWAGRIDGRRARAMKSLRQEQRERHSELSRGSVDYDQGSMDYDRVMRARECIRKL
jgi:hypothetical protein